MSRDIVEANAAEPDHRVGFVAGRCDDDDWPGSIQKGSRPGGILPIQSGVDAAA
jgi:hypothetical protein